MHRRIKFITPITLALMLLLIHLDINAQVKKKIYDAQSLLDNETPQVDGKLNDEVWKNGNWSSNFIQREPNENVPPTEQTAFKIAYNAKYLFIAFKCFDTNPNLISNRMSRRDGLEGDFVQITFDSYHDLTSAFSFSITSAGVKGDKMISSNGNEEDLTWNPIWYAKSNISNNKWTAEMKIPLSQLRFDAQSSQVWGLQVLRKYFRKNETSVWQRIPLDVSGIISEFGELHGLNGLTSQNQLEIQPYALSSLKTIEKQVQNPFKNSNIKKTNVGVDGKIGVTNNLTLDFSINPDFGQVEADPAALALDGFQLFFNEQRPFFVENKNIFNYQFTSARQGGQFSSDNLFYSRRIGRSPQISSSLNKGEYINQKERTTILGALKFSGKTKKGWSIGILESVTANEYDKISDGNSTTKSLSEPLSNYFVGRIKKDLNHNNTFIGGILTSTIRQSGNLGILHKYATTGGFDFLHQWNQRSWYFGSNVVSSIVQGSNKAISNTQSSIRHLFQRTDANHVKVDSNRTYLAGTGGDLKIGKSGNGHIKFETGLTWRTPGLELNDLGFLRQADIVQNYAAVSYNTLKPFSIFRKAVIKYQHWLIGDFEKNLNFFDYDIQINSTFNNNWGAVLGLFSQPTIYSKSLLQGGPRVYLPDQYGAWWAFNTDSRKKLILSYNGWTKTGNSDSHFLIQSGLNIIYQPTNQLKLSLGPSYSTVKHRLQYVETIKQAGSNKYVVARLNQKTMSTSIRLDYTLTPNLTIQYYGEPYISTGLYKDFGQVIQPLSKNQNEQIKFYSSNQLSLSQDERYQIDDDGNGISDFSIGSPHFSYVQFRSNLVVRYEYLPGSEIYLVWSQGITDQGGYQSRFIDNLKNQLLNQKPENTILIKLTYRFIK